MALKPRVKKNWTAYWERGKGDYMPDKVTAESAIKAVHDFANSLTKEDWRRLEVIHFLDFHGLIDWNSQNGAQDEVKESERL